MTRYIISYDGNTNQNHTESSALTGMLALDMEKTRVGEIMETVNPGGNKS